MLAIERRDPVEEAAGFGATEGHDSASPPGDEDLLLLGDLIRKRIIVEGVPLVDRVAVVHRSGFERYGASVAISVRDRMPRR